MGTIESLLSFLQGLTVLTVMKFFMYEATCVFIHSTDVYMPYPIPIDRELLSLPQGDAAKGWPSMRQRTLSHLQQVLHTIQVEGTSEQCP